MPATKQYCRNCERGFIAVKFHLISDSSNNIKLSLQISRMPFLATDDCYFTDQRHWCVPGKKPASELFKKQWEGLRKDYP